VKLKWFCKVKLICFCLILVISSNTAHWLFFIKRQNIELLNLISLSKCELQILSKLWFCMRALSLIILLLLNHNALLYSHVLLNHFLVALWVQGQSNHDIFLESRFFKILLKCMKAANEAVSCMIWFLGLDMIRWRIIWILRTDGSLWDGRLLLLFLDLTSKAS